MPDLLAEWREEEKKKIINFNVDDFVVGKGFEKVKNLRYNGDIPEWLYYNGL